uniref:Apoptosis inhibitor 5 n=1 Tax=Aceria tosichella TaxID=561515 RepID=A0A6G1SAS1_9ACAR
MAEDRLTILYDWSEAMTSAGDQVKEKYETEYKKIIEYVKTSENNKERILAAQLLSRFFKFFPELEDSAFDSIVDLCESADVDVRKHATLVMISICRGSKQVVSKAADILIQLYQTNQPSEVTLINQSLNTLLNLNIEQFLKSFYANFEDGSELVRERALKFLSSKISTVSENALTKEVEEKLMEYTKKAMEDVTKDEFISFINILSKLKISKTSTGQATLVSAIKSQAELDKPFDAKNTEALDKFLLCTRHTIPFLSQYNRASEYVNYICLNVLPVLKELIPNGNDLHMLQILAEMSPHIIIEDVPNLIDLDKCHQTVYSKLLEYLPLPPETMATTETKPAQPLTVVEQPKETGAANDQNGDKHKAESTTENPEVTKEVGGDQQQEDSIDNNNKAPTGGDQRTEKVSEAAAVVASSKPAPAQEVDFQFSHIEYLMYTFVQLSRLKPELYTEAMQVGSRKQLSHLSNGCKKYTDALEKQLTSIKRQDLNKDENKLRSTAIRTTKNISTMILGLFKKPPDFKTSITLSFKPVVVNARGNKRPADFEMSRNNNSRVRR